ncbi:MAG: cupin domain-containing protein [Nitrospinota bacterium]
MKKLVFRPGDGEPLRMPGQTAPRGWEIVVDPKGVGARQLSFGVQDVDVGSHIPIHMHDKEEEILFFWGGKGKVIVEDEEFEVFPGCTAFLPIDVWHGVVNTGDEPLRLTWCFSPPGYEEEFRRMTSTGVDHTPPPKSG